jgi:hypothetical protein
MAHCVGSIVNTGHIKAIAFHQKCFREVAGEEYSDSLQSDETTLTKQDVNEVFGYNYSLLVTTMILVFFFFLVFYGTKFLLFKA